MTLYHLAKLATVLFRGRVGAVDDDMSEGFEEMLGAMIDEALAEDPPQPSEESDSNSSKSEPVSPAVGGTVTPIAMPYGTPYSPPGGARGIVFASLCGSFSTYVSTLLV